jgi:KaiC/GvpD/RAD55 family RecA-like ATPase
MAAKGKGKSTQVSVASERVQTGISGIDELIEGGLPENSLVLLAGHCGTGRHTFAMQFLYHGAKNGEPGVYISMEKEPEEIISSMKSFGWDLDSLIKERKLVIIKPDMQRFDTLKKTIEDEIDRIGAKRLVLSPFSFISAYFANVYDARKALSELRNQMKKLNCTAIAITDIKEGEQVFSSTGFEEFVSSGVIVLDLMLKKENNTYVRTVLIRKMERTNHSLKLIPIEISKEGITAYPDAEVF